jgi:UDPglucose 6-dehydrogenase
VTVVDIDEDRIARWATGRLPVHETGLKEILDIVQVRDPPLEDAMWDRDTKQPDPTNGQSTVLPHTNRKPNLNFSTHVRRAIEEADLILVAVDTPQLDSSNAHSGDLVRKVFSRTNQFLDASFGLNLAPLASATSMVAEAAAGETIVVLKSTVPPSITSAIGQYVRLLERWLGTTRLIYIQLNSNCQPKASFSVLYNPELLAQGSAVRDFLSPRTVVIGSDYADAPAADAL